MEDYVALGEGIQMFERLAVSPTWGRVTFSAIEPGTRLSSGTVVAVVTESGVGTPIVCHCDGTFLGRLVEDGARVWPARPLVWFVAAGPYGDNGADGSHSLA